MSTVYNRNESAAIPGDAVFVGRPSKFGNPFVIGTHGSRDEVIALFREWLTATDDGRAVVQAAAAELEGKDLICFCAPEACHADVLLEIANRD
jgi:hypothetical protein